RGRARSFRICRAKPGGQARVPRRVAARGSGSGLKRAAGDATTRALEVEDWAATPTDAVSRTP
ncbi:MAG: hypothetical protein MUF14_06570, partial [Hyphomonadaceae bacterium]|nr:hypothetical protein [Hyphomonadaceae bacterium]